MRALKRWKPELGSNKREVLIIDKSDLSGSLHLPPSKSHAMRWLILASMDNSSTQIEMEEIGKDVEAMIRCLEQLGIKYEDGIITGGDLSRPIGVLNCANSGTAFRFLLAQTASCSFPVMLDGDNSLRVRSSSPLIESLGVSTSQGFGLETNPVLVNGPISKQEIEIDVSQSSQFYSALMLMSPRTAGFKLKTKGKPVSRRHSQLTWELCQLTGATQPGDAWKVNCPDVIIPPDASMIAFARLAGLEVDNLPKDSELIGNEILNSDEEFDLTDANDLITPLAAILALQGGGKITGAAHAVFKESNRITRTVSMLADFGLVATPTDDGLIIGGGQIPTKPKGIVETYTDHRIQMTAILLAAKVGAVVEGMKLHEIAWPSYLEQLQKNGLIVESQIVQP